MRPPDRLVEAVWCVVITGVLVLLAPEAWAVALAISAFLLATVRAGG